MSEETLIRHCSPTLAGIKTGNIFSCTHESTDVLRDQIRALNRRLASRGLCILPLRISESSALIYVYRPSKLRADLAGADAAAVLASRGYSDAKPSRCIATLAERLKGGDFPHEIGLFLGYPVEDVIGFIEKRECKLSGAWKVYGDEELARRTFAKYKKCTDVYTRQHRSGKPIERLTVSRLGV